MATTWGLISFVVLLCSGSTLCLGGDSWCSSANARVSIGDHQDGNQFGKTFVQFFDVSTTVSPGTEATKVKAEKVNVNIEITLVRTWRNGQGGHDEEERRSLRAQLVRWGTYESRIRGEFHPLTTAIKKVYVKNVTCDNLPYSYGQ
jgi:hypothetical protein